MHVYISLCPVGLISEEGSWLAVCLAVPVTEEEMGLLLPNLSWHFFMSHIKQRLSGDITPLLKNPACRLRLPPRGSARLLSPNVRSRLA